MKQRILFVFFLISIQQLLHAQPFNKGKMDSLFAALSVNNKAMGSIAISKDGKPVYSNSIGYTFIDKTDSIAANIKTKYRIGSISKMFTTVLIFQLIEEKKLSLEDKLDKYFPVIPNAAKISIADLLNHHSGIHNFTNDSAYITYYLQPHTKQQMLDIIRAAPSDFEPGSKGEYSNSNFILLGYIAEKISKKSYSQLLKEKIVRKLALENTFLFGKADVKKNEAVSYSFINDWKPEPETDVSIPGGAGAIASTPLDLNKFIEGLFSGKLVSKESLVKMQALKDNYGMGMFMIPFNDKKSWGHNGGIDGFGSMLAYFPGDSLAVAYCTNGQVYPMNDILIGVLSIYFNRPYKIPGFSTVSLSSNELYQYIGSYESAQIPLKITVSIDGSLLMAQATGQSAFPLESTAKDVFVFDKAGIVMKFSPADGSFELEQGGRTFQFKKVP